MHPLAGVVPPEIVSTDPEDLRAHTRDWWPLAMVRERRGDRLVQPAAIARPHTTQQVASILRWADETKTPVVPYGGGSAVTGAAQAVEGAIALDTGRLDEIDVDGVALNVTAGAGVMGPVLESSLNSEGLTLGHFPQSIEISTVGGWLATRSAGQKSNTYGRIDDMVLGLEAVLPGGRVVNFPARAGTSAGPDLAKLFLGSEGTLGVITRATLSVRPVPESVSQAAYGFGSFKEGLDALRTMAREGTTPAVARLYDEADAQIAFREAAPGGCVLVLRCEDEAVPEVAGARLDDALATGWWTHRNDAVETFRTIMLERSLGETTVVDTMEVSGLWPVDKLYGAVREALSKHADAAGCHASHVYPHGVCLYFTFALLNSTDDVQAERRYLEVWEAGQRAALDAGGSITHHHGVGLLRLPWIEEELRGSMELLRTIKRAIDPANIMNPGKLIP